MPGSMLHWNPGLFLQELYDRTAEPRQIHVRLEISYVTFDMSLNIFGS